MVAGIEVVVRAGIADRTEELERIEGKEWIEVVDGTEVVDGAVVVDGTEVVEEEEAVEMAEVGERIGRIERTDMWKAKSKQRQRQRLSTWRLMKAEWEGWKIEQGSESSLESPDHRSMYSGRALSLLLARPHSTLPTPENEAPNAAQRVTKHDSDALGVSLTGSLRLRLPD